MNFKIRNIIALLLIACINLTNAIAQNELAEDILEKLSNTSGPSARNYLDENLFLEAGIRIQYMEYEYEEYEQRFPPFDPFVSVLDLMFMTGPNAPRYIWE